MSYFYKIYPDFEKMYFFQLYLFRTTKAYDKKRGEFNFTTTGSMGCFVGNWIGKKYDKKRPLGAILIDLTSCPDVDVRANVVAHECTHASVHYMRRCRQLKLLMKRGDECFKKKYRQKNPEKIPEERLCYAVGRLVAQVTRALKQDKRYKT